MERTFAIEKQNFESIINENYFYVDKTEFIRDWWERKHAVTLITRPQRFGKTLNMSMLECFFSNKYENRGDLFEGLDIWKYEEYREIQGTYPVISVSFAEIKGHGFKSVYKALQEIFSQVYSEHRYLLDSDRLAEYEKTTFRKILEPADNEDLCLYEMALNYLSEYLYKHFGKRAIILLDDYDTPMLETYKDESLKKITAFFRNILLSTFKVNDYLEQAMMVGVTRVSKESMLEDVNNLVFETIMSGRYETAFGFTEEEVFAAMHEIGLTEKDKVRYWYGGFAVEKTSDIYNPGSIINYLDTGKFESYCVNTNLSSLAGKLIREGGAGIKADFEVLINGGVIEQKIDEQIMFEYLGLSQGNVWSLLLASGYLKIVTADNMKWKYELTLTNYEVKRMFEKLFSGWFKRDEENYNEFIKALLTDDKEAMRHYINRVSQSVYSYFDTGNRPYGAEPDRFYHGFVLGLMVDLRDRYIITPNRESGFERHDIIMEPLDKEKYDGIIIEFKVLNKRREKNLKETVTSALKQIEQKNYAQTLTDRGVNPKRIRKYGFAFEGKTVEIG